MMNHHLFGAASLLVLSAGLTACSDASFETPDNGVSESTAALTTATPDDGKIEDDDDDVEADAADDAVATADEDAAADPQADPNYIVYYVPLTNTLLYNDVFAFLHLFQSAATNLPPHVSVTGFFSSSKNEAQAGDTFRATVDKIGTPFGNTPTVGAVHCRTVTVQGAKSAKPPKNYLIDIHVTFTGKKWAAFENALFSAFNVPKSKQRDVSNYHVTLFETRVGSVTHKKFNDVCAAARAKFPASKNAKTYGATQFGTALFEQAGTGVTQVVNTSFQVTK